MADPVVHITNGVPDSGTGNITTLGAVVTALGTPMQTSGGSVTANAGTNLNTSLLALETGGNLAAASGGIGAAADAVVAAGAAGSLSAKLRAISRDLVANIVLAAGNNIIGLFKLSDGTNTAAVKAANIAPAATDPAVVVAISPNSVNANGRALPSASAPVVLSSMTYTAVAASQTAALLGATGASGDYLDGVLIIPATAAAGSVTITDGGGSAITIFAGGGTTALPTLAPFFVPIGAISKGGAGGWKVTTGTNVSVIGIGNFT